MTADATVVAADGNGLVDLEFMPAARCGACHGTCLWKRLQSARIERMRVDRALKPGSRVTVSLPDRRILIASMTVHGLPLLAILAGAAAGAAIGGSDLGTLIGVLAALALVIPGFGPLKRWIERDTLAHLDVQPKE